MATLLILVRHGQPQTGEGTNRTDPPLSTEGSSQTRKVALHLHKQGYKPNVIYSSPLARALQSAEIISRVDSAPVKPLDALSGNFDQDALIRLLPPPSEEQTVYMVGHDPTLSLFAHNLVGQKILPAGLSRSGVVVLEFNDSIGLGKGRMVAYYNPDRI